MPRQYKQPGRMNRMPTIDQAFEGGGVGSAHFVDDTHIEFSAPMDGSPQSLWYYFRVSGAKGTTLYFSQKGLEHVLGVRESRGYVPVVPVFRGASGAWKRVDERSIRFCSDPLRYEFSVTPEDDECYVAFCYPYLLEDFTRFIEARHSPQVSAYSIGKTQEGRDLPCFLVGDLENPDIKQMVVLFARQHAGEVSGSFVLEGFLDALLDGGAEAQAALSTTLFCIFPFVDLDSVQRGRYGKDRFPVDFNGDWSRQPYHCEIRLIQAELARLATRYHLLWGFDLHAPQPGGASYLPPNKECPAHSPDWRRMWGFALAYEDACEREGCSFHLHDVDTEVLNWGGSALYSHLGVFLRARYACPLLSLEYTYHRTGEGSVVHPEDWCKMGKILFQTLANHLSPEHCHFDILPEERIPSWAIPPLWEHWTSISKVRGISVSERGAALVLHPSAPQNHIWLSSRDLFCCDPADSVLTIVSEKAVNITLCYFFFADGEFVEKSPCFYAHLIGEKVIGVPDRVPADADQFGVMIEMNNISEEVVLQLGQV